MEKGLRMREHRKALTLGGADHLDDGIKLTTLPSSIQTGPATEKMKVAGDRGRRIDERTRMEGPGGLARKAADRR